MVVNFTDKPVRTRQGAPRVNIPAEIIEWCQHTYTKNVSCELPLDPESQEAPEVLRVLRIYATREGKSISHEFIEIDGTPHLRFRMRDKQTRQTPKLPKER
jgi:hypothetical protein